MTVELSDEQDDPLQADELQSLARSVLLAEKLPPEAFLSLRFVGVDEMTLLNERYMGKQGPTDVLSFPIEELTPGHPPVVTAGDPPLVLGDIVVCPEVVRTQAEAFAVPFDDEMALMVVHGVLHLLGYDHVVAAEAEEMEQRERDLLALVGRRRP